MSTDYEPVVFSNDSKELLSVLERSVPRDQRVTTPYLTRFERARVLGVRALQLSMNAPVNVDLSPSDTDALAIAEKELRCGKLPLVVRRYLPDGCFEDWNVAELIL